MSQSPLPGARRPLREDRRLEPRRPDPYRARGKLADPTGCPECGACFREGRWTWRRAPVDAPQALCPACQRIRDDQPGGYATLEGDFVREHEAEILGLVRNVEERERREHPLKRIMAIRPAEETGGLLVTTTDPHLAHALVKALFRAWEGELEADWATGETLLRARWRRELPPAE